jgi:hypothetical protein
VSVLAPPPADQLDVAGERAVEDGEPILEQLAHGDHLVVDALRRHVAFGAGLADREDHRVGDAEHGDIVEGAERERPARSPGPLS